MKKIYIRTKAVVCILILILLPSISIASARQVTPEKKGIYPPQFVLIMTSTANDTIEPILPNETRTVHLQIVYAVVRGVFGGLVLRFLEGRPSPISLIIVDKSDWCTVTLSLSTITGVVSPHISQGYANLTITLSEDAPPSTMGYVEIGGSINDVKGPFNLLSFIWGCDGITTVNFFTGPE